MRGCAIKGWQMDPFLQELVDQWLEWAAEEVDEGAALAYAHCADMLAAIATSVKLP